MTKQSRSLLSTIGQYDVLKEANKGTALEQIKAAEAVLVSVTKQAITHGLEKAGKKGASSSELTYMAGIGGWFKGLVGLLKK